MIIRYLNKDILKSNIFKTVIKYKSLYEYVLEKLILIISGPMLIDI